MEDSKNSKQQADSCACCCHNNPYGNYHYHGGFFLVRIILAIVLALFVFWLGLKIGQLRGSYMGYFDGNNRCAYPMMQYYNTGSGTGGVALPPVTK